MSLERDIARAARELREDRRIERQEWRKIHRFVREHEPVATAHPQRGQGAEVTGRNWSLPPNRIAQ